LNNQYAGFLGLAGTPEIPAPFTPEEKILRRLRKKPPDAPGSGLFPDETSVQYHAGTRAEENRRRFPAMNPSQLHPCSRNRRLFSLAGTGWEGSPFSLGGVPFRRGERNMVTPPRAGSKSRSGPIRTEPVQDVLPMPQGETGRKGWIGSDRNGCHVTRGCLRGRETIFPKVKARWPLQ